MNNQEMLQQIEATAQEWVNDAPIDVLMDYVYEDLVNYYTTKADREEVHQFLEENRLCRSH